MTRMRVKGLRLSDTRFKPGSLPLRKRSASGWRT
jgi:hypothetical protein